MSVCLGSPSFSQRSTNPIEIRSTMRTSFSLLFTCLVAFTCLLTLNPTTVNARIHCGTTSDAPYDDCKALMDSKWEFNLQRKCLLFLIDRIILANWAYSHLPFSRGHRGPQCRMLSEL